MNVPTPASIKAQLDKKKALESSETPDSSKSASSAKEKAPRDGSNAPKREYVRPEHLTQRPFKDNEQLQKLKETLPQNRKQNHKPQTEAEKRTAAAKKRAKDRAYNVKIAMQLRDKGMSNVAIGKKMGMNESTIRGLLPKNPKNIATKNTSKESN